MIYSQALRSLLSIVSLTPTSRPPALDSYFHPETSILVSRVNLLPAVSRSQPGSKPLFPLPSFSALSPSIRFRCTHRRTMNRSVVFTGRFGLGRYPSLQHDESFLHAPRFSPFDSPFLPFFLFRCFAISRLYLLTDSFAITRSWHSYRLFQSSCPNVGSMTSACTG